MKAHLKKGIGFIACGSSGRHQQSKGIILGLNPKYFAAVPEADRCASCNAKFKAMQSRKANQRTTV